MAFIYLPPLRSRSRHSGWTCRRSSGAPPPCASGCGFFGSPATLGLCSVCYKKRGLADGYGEPAPSTVSVSTSPEAAAVTAGVSLVPPTNKAGGIAEAPAPTASSEPEAASPNRCARCRKKVGLATGFTCRCGSTFCGGHRHAEEHGCAFDFKAAGRDAVDRDNPVVKCDKLPDKI